MFQGLCKAGLENQINLHSAYGMSETCPLVTVANLKPHMQAWDADRQVEMRCRTGLPVPNVLLEVVDIQGNRLPHDGQTAGEVVVR
jgi:fatty-acyl-CoA synthase